MPVGERSQYWNHVLVCCVVIVSCTLPALQPLMLLLLLLLVIPTGKRRSHRPCQTLINKAFVQDSSRMQVNLCYSRSDQLGRVLLHESVPLKLHSLPSCNLPACSSKEEFVHEMTSSASSGTLNSNARELCASLAGKVTAGLVEINSSLPPGV